MAGYKLGFRLARGSLENKFPSDMLEEVSARTLLVAATVDDDVEGTKGTSVALRKGKSTSRAAKIAGMRHLWNLQDPALIARALEAWLTEGEVLKEFEVL